MESISKTLIKKGKLFRLQDRLIEDGIKRIIKKALFESTGSDFVANPTALKFRRGILFLSFDYSAFCAQVFFKRELFKDVINKSLEQKDLIKEIRFIKARY